MRRIWALVKRAVTRRRTRVRDEPGMVTAETAIVMPQVFMGLILAVVLLSQLIDVVGVENAAKEISRGIALGMTAEEIYELGIENAGSNAEVATSQAGDVTTVTVRRPARGLMGEFGVVYTGSHSIVVEPGVVP